MSNIKLFEDKKIRVVYDEEKGDYWFCLVDVVETLTNSKDPNQYLKRIRSRDEMLNFYIGTNCTHVEMINKNDKRRKVLAGTTKDILRLIQSIPSPKAEPFKLWLASLGSERLDEISNPELAINRGLEYYKSKGHEESWISQRITSIGIRKELTDEWKSRGISEEKDFAILTNEMLKAWSGMTVKKYKKVKGLEKESLRDNMSNLEIVLNMLAEVTTTEISKKEKPKTFSENISVAKRGGKIANNAKIDVEKEINSNKEE